MDPEIKLFIDNVDEWIKQIRKEFANFVDLPSVVSENTDNIQHNYELIYDLKDLVEELKQEVNALKLIQIINLKQANKEASMATKQTELILKKEGCMDILRQLLNSFGNKTLKEVLEDYQHGISSELSISNKDLRKIDDMLSSKPLN